MRQKDKFVELFNLFIKKNRTKLASNTLYNYDVTRRKIENFLPDITIREVDEDFVQEYILHYKHNKNTTLKKDISTIRKVLEWAFRKGIISRMPLIDFKLPEEEPIRTYLLKSELKKLLKYYETELPPGMENSLKLFLFSCFTGLRYSDAINLRPENLTEDDDGNKFIRIPQKKTKRIVMVPLHPTAEELLELDQKTRRFFKWQRVQVVNKNLKKIAQRCGIDKNLSTHVARHTFAMLSLQAGMDLQAIQSFLGHRRITTTQIYAKLLPEAKMKEFQKLKKFLED